MFVRVYIKRDGSVEFLALANGKGESGKSLSAAYRLAEDLGCTVMGASKRNPEHPLYVESFCFYPSEEARTEAEE